MIARPDFPTEESVLTEHKTDVIIACFGMGESFDGEAGLEGFKSDLERIHRQPTAGKKYNGKIRGAADPCFPNRQRRSGEADAQPGEAKPRTRSLHRWR